MALRWRQRQRVRSALKTCRQPALGQYLEACRSLHVGTLDRTPLLAVDLELTGLDAKQDTIVSIGWVELRASRLLLGSAHHALIKGVRSVGDSATVHEIVDQELLTGQSLDVALESLFQAASGKLFLFHHAGLDTPILQRACRQWAGCVPPMPTLDTLRWEQQRRSRRNQAPKPGDLQLAKLRDHYGLPGHSAHDALGDAVATAELFLAMAAHANPSGPLPLAPLVRWY